ncbi:KIF-binding protein-like isoform X2 [Artemia franciscana]|uniref:KIF-binding protein-like isoform X2 n=1 Tax=Artemia franciscana TaxID=6661 RepID=UPI0032DBB56F
MIEAASVYSHYESLIENSVKDPETDPYRSKYKAICCLNGFLDVMTTFGTIKQGFESSPNELHILCLRAAVLFLVGKLKYETNEAGIAETLLLESLSKASATPDVQKTLQLKLSILNQLGLIYCDLSKHEQAEGVLLEAISLYEETKNMSDKLWCVKDIFYGKIVDQNVSDDNLESENTLTLYYIAQVYQHLGKSSESAKYCSLTLRKQLERGVTDTIYWALNCATLSQYFASRNFFELERYHYRLADIQRCWAKYDLLLIDHSWELVQETPVEKHELHFNCPRFPEAEIARFEDVPFQTARTFEEARVIFLHGQKMLNAAKSYYSLEDRATDYFEIVQEHSHLFRSLAKFEIDNGRESKMHRRRIDMLEDILKVMNKTLYLNVAQQIYFELGETYSDLFALKLEKVEALKKLRDHATLPAVVKANQVAEKAIKVFTEFLDLYRDKNGKIPESLGEDNIRPVLLARFYIGRFTSKFYSTDAKKIIQSFRSAIEHFEYVIQYCANSKLAKDLLSEELPVCTEMVQLLSLKIQRMVNP